MAVTAHKLGPGVLTLGESGTLKEFTSQVTNARWTPSVDQEDPIHVLSGEQIADDPDISSVIAGTFLQEYGAEALVTWCWEHRGEVLPFSFKPRTDADLTISGRVPGAARRGRRRRQDPRTPPTSSSPSSATRRSATQRRSDQWRAGMRESGSRGSASFVRLSAQAGDDLEDLKAAHKAAAEIAAGGSQPPRPGPLRRRSPAPMPRRRHQDLGRDPRRQESSPLRRPDPLGLAESRDRTAAVPRRRGEEYRTAMGRVVLSSARQSTQES